MAEALFVYGTLIDSAVQKTVIGRELALQADTLPNFRHDVIALGQHVYPQVQEAPGHCVDGWVMEVTREELQCIDYYETDAYQRAWVQLSSGRYAWVYCQPVDYLQNLHMLFG